MRMNAIVTADMERAFQVFPPVRRISRDIVHYYIRHNFGQEKRKVCFILDTSKKRRPEYRTHTHTHTQK